MYTLKVSSKTILQMKETYKTFIIPNEGEYVDFMAKLPETIITAYKSQKETKKVTFSGKNAYFEAKKWDDTLLEETLKKEVVKEHWLDYEDQIGSDEVGVGDFLLPIIVVASYVSPSDIKKLISLGVHDSKKLTDTKILEIGPSLIKFIHYSKLTLSNEKYNEVISNGENLNSVKAKMHNRALKNLHHKYEDVTHIYVDQFVSEKKYYEYLNDENEEQVKGISFKTKGESYFPSVAVSSVIARYFFLLEREKLNNHYQVEIPFGASTKVNTFSKEFIKKYGLKEFRKLSKNNFVNFKEVILKN